MQKIDRYRMKKSINFFILSPNYSKIIKVYLKQQYNYSHYFIRKYLCNQLLKLLEIKYANE